MMKKKIQIYLLEAVLLLSGIFVQPVSARSVEYTQVATKDEACRQWVDSVFSRLTRNEKIGQLLVATLPAEASRQNKKMVRTLVRKYKIGGLVFDGGTPEEQAILTNLAQGGSELPLLITTRGRRLSDRLSGVPVFPNEAALQCMTDTILMQKYRTEALREFHELGMFGDILPAELEGERFLEGMVVSYGNALREHDELVKALQSGELTEDELEERCRKVLARKYMLGLRGRQPNLQVSGISYRINTESAQALAADLRRAAVTVVSNYFGVLPLAPVEGDIAVLSIGEAGKDSAFVERLKESAGIVRYQLAADADAAACESVRLELQPFRRMIVSITGQGLQILGPEVQNFLESLEVQAPLVYAFFAPFQSTYALEQALARSSALVLAHSQESDLQQYVADVLFAKASATGRLFVNIGRSFPVGAGCSIATGMKPVRMLPEDIGMKSYVLQQIDKVAIDGLKKGVYPGCRILVWKNGQTIYDRGFGTHSLQDTTSVRQTDMFDLGALTMPMSTVLAVMKLYEEGQLKLDAKVSSYLPFLRGSNKRNITIRDLLFHEAGLAPHLRFYIETIDPRSVHGPYAQSWADQWHRTRVSEHSYFCTDFKFKKGLISSSRTSSHTLQVADGLWLNKSFKNTMLQMIAKSDLIGRRSVYSSLVGILLQQVVESITQLPLNLYVAKEFYAPMGLQRTMYLPLSRYDKSEIMPTAFNDFLCRQDLCGYVYDKTAACMGGVSGNAGLFSTAGEVATVFQMLLNGGEWNGKRFLNEQTCHLFTTETSKYSRRGLGFDRPDASVALRSPCSLSTPATVYGHTGSTGTCAWADPENGLVYVFLSNSLCPNAWNTKLGDLDIRENIQELIYQSLKK